MVHNVDIVELFCKLDDFCVEWSAFLDRHSITDLSMKCSKTRPFQMSLSEVMTIETLFYLSGYRTFKDFYYGHVSCHARKEFPRLVSYSRFIELRQKALLPFVFFLRTQSGTMTGLNFIDSTAIHVCKNIRINRHKTCKGLAKRGKTSIGWFYGFKLHLVINDRGEIMSFCFSPGNTNDRLTVPFLADKLQGILCGDRGYISSSLKQMMAEKKITLITKKRSNMKSQKLPLLHEQLLKKRSLIETVFGQLKEQFSLSADRCRSALTFFVNCTASLVAYIFKNRFPSLNRGFFIPQN